MKKKYVIPGLILLILGLLLQYDTNLLGQGLNTVGFSNQQTALDKSYFRRVSSSNYSFIPFTLTPQDSMKATIQSNPRGIDVFVMDQANFLKFNSSNGNFGSTVYPQSILNVTSYTLNFNESTTSGNFTLVFTHPQSTSSTDILVHMTIVRTVTTLPMSYFPIVLAIIGILLLAAGIIVVPQRSKPLPKSSQVYSQPRPVASVPERVACKYCGAAMNRSDPFCSACKRAQF